MITTAFRELAEKHSLTIASGMGYGMLNGCYITLTEETGLRRISIYVGPQTPVPAGVGESHTVSCARQIIHAISTASGADNIYGLMTGKPEVPALILNHAGSVVTVNFSDSPEAMKGVERFLSELLPQIAPLTCPQLCIYCGQPTAGSGCPVRLSTDTVVPMHASCLKQAVGNHATPREERIALLKAVLCAAAGALIGATLWTFLSGFGPVAWGVGVLMGLLPVLGYDLLKGPAGRARIITVIACAVSAVILGSLGACAWSLHQSFVAHGKVAQQMVSELAYMKAQFDYDAAALPTLIQTLIAGTIFAGIGCLALLRRTAAATAEAARPRRLKGTC